MRYLFFLATACFCISANAQDGKIYFFKKDWSSAKTLDQCTYFMHEIPESDSLYIRRYYRKAGPMLRWESYRDASCKIPNGIFAWYNEQGAIDSSGLIIDGKKDKLWSYQVGDNGPLLTESFENGHMEKRIDYTTRMITYANGETDRLDKPKSADASQKDKEFIVVQVPAEFPGGLKAWSEYLSKTIVTPDRFIVVSKHGTRASVGISFMVEGDGTLSNIFIEKSCEWSIDLQSIRVIQSAPKWKPATQNGKVVKYKHKQNITYAVN